MRSKPRRGKVIEIVAIAAALIVGVVGGIAYASNTHTTGEWYHGLGDGTDDDNYVHPFNDTTNDHKHRQTVSVSYEAKGGAWYLHAIKSCSEENKCGHLHINVDTLATAHENLGECKFWSRHRMWGDSEVAGHEHDHHDDCTVS